MKYTSLAMLFMAFFLSLSDGAEARRHHVRHTIHARDTTPARVVIPHVRVVDNGLAQSPFETVHPEIVQATLDTSTLLDPWHQQMMPHPIKTTTVELPPEKVAVEDYVAKTFLASGFLLILFGAYKRLF
jgi:hypothetical protein